MSDQDATLLIYTLHCGNFYGTERMAMATLEGFDGHRRVVLAPPSASAPSLLDMARRSGYEVRAADKPLRVLMALVPLFLRHRCIDVISTSALHNLICAMLARIFFVRLRQLNVAHGGSDEKYAYAKKFRLNKTRIVVIAVSRFVQQRLLANHVVPEKVVVIENFLASDDADTRPRRAAFEATSAGAKPIDPSHVRVVVVSRLEAFKRIDVLLDAVAGGSLDQFVFEVYGTGELLAACRQSGPAREGRVNFHGYDHAVASRLAEADFFLHLCPDEPFGLVVLEAFSAGIPVVVPRSGGTDELVEEGVDGLKYAPTDPAALAACLRDAALLRGEVLDAIVARGRESLAGRFSAANGAKAYRHALNSVNDQ